MKSIWGATILIIVIIAVTFFLTRDMFRSEVLYYDDDQEGLNEQIVIRFSHVVAEDTPKGLAAQKFANIMNEKTGGRVRVEVFPNGVLYSDSEEFSALLQNDVQMIAPSFSKMTDIAPEWELFDLPFVFNSLEDVEQSFTGEIGDQLLSMLDDRGMKGLALWSNGFKQMTSYKQPLVLPDDFKNQRFRIMPSPVIEQQFKLLNAIPVVIPFNEVYYSLDRFIVDGQENTISNIYSRRWHELQRYMTISNHGYLGYTVLMNEGFWNQLPDDIQIKLTEGITETTKWILEESERMNKNNLKDIEEHSDMEIYYLTERNQQVWKEALQPIYDKFIKEADPQFLKLVEPLIDSGR